MTAATADVTPVLAPGLVRQLGMAAASVGAALVGVTPHVLHHAGPLAGAALFAGLSGTLLFGALGLMAATPLLLTLRRRSGSSRKPATVLALFTTLFAVSSVAVEHHPSLRRTE